jgi:hypothetical protein
VTDGCFSDRQTLQIARDFFLSVVQSTADNAHRAERAQAQSFTKHRVTHPSIDAKLMRFNAD